MFGKARRLESENAALKAELAAAQVKLENPFYTYAEQMQADVAASLRDGRGDVAVQDAINRMTRQTREAAIKHRLETDPIEEIIPVYESYTGKEFVIEALERVAAERRIPVEAKAKQKVIELQAKRKIFDFANLVVGQEVRVGLYSAGYVTRGQTNFNGNAARIITGRVDNEEDTTQLTVINDSYPNGLKYYQSLSRPSGQQYYDPIAVLDDHDIVRFGTERIDYKQSFSYVTHGTIIAAARGEASLATTACDLGFLAVDDKDVLR